MRTHVKLFIPGPIEVSEQTRQAMAQPMIGHRSKDFQNLFADVQPMLQEIFFTKRPVYLSTSSSWGLMEAAVRNLVTKKVLNCCCGGFSDKWFDASLSCGKSAEQIKVEWGEPILPEAIDRKLSKGGFDAVTLVHNETSTGVMNPLPEIAEVVKKYPDVMLIVDCVSSFSSMKIPFDELGVDVLLTGSQKAFALPPGLSLFACSERALERAAKVKDRGYYFDFLEFDAQAKRNMTPSTPCISLIFALQFKLKEIFAEGLDKRFQRHKNLKKLVHDWVKKSGFQFFAPDGYRAPTLTCVKNNKDIDVTQLTTILKDKHKIAINGGYSKIKGKTFRLSHMGDEQISDIEELLTALDDSLDLISR